MSGEFDLPTLLQPLSEERFFAEHWESKPLLLQRGDSAYYDPLVTVADVESYLSRTDARYPAIRLAKNGAFYAPEAYKRPGVYSASARRIFFSWRRWAELGSG